MLASALQEEDAPEGEVAEDPFDVIRLRSLYTNKVTLTHITFFRSALWNTSSSFGHLKIKQDMSSGFAGRSRAGGHGGGLPTCCTWLFCFMAGRVSLHAGCGGCREGDGSGGGRGCRRKFLQLMARKYWHLHCKRLHPKRLKMHRRRKW